MSLGIRSEQRSLGQQHGGKGLKPEKSGSCQGEEMGFPEEHWPGRVGQGQEKSNSIYPRRKKIRNRAQGPP